MIMRVATIVATFALAASGFLQLISASPIHDVKDTLVKRDNTDIMQVMTGLNHTVAPILIKLDTLVANKQASMETVTPLLTELKTALTTGAAELSHLAPARFRKRQIDREVAQITAHLVAAIATTLDGVAQALGGLPIIGGIFLGIDSALNQIFVGLSVLLRGVLNLVSNLLSGVAGVLRGLAFGLHLPGF